MPNLGTTEKLIFTIVSAGNGVINQSPKIIIQKQSNGYFFNGAGFVPSIEAIELAMLEESSTNFPGRYSYSFNQALDIGSSSNETYSIRYKNIGTYSLVVDEEINFTAPTTVSYTAQSLPGIEFTRPGFQNPEQTNFVINGSEKRIKAAFVDSNSSYYDPYELSVQIYDYSRNLILSETINPPAIGTNIKRDNAGNYYIDFTQTTNDGEYTFIWSYRDIINGEKFYATQYLIVTPIHVISLLPNLRNQIDKSQKDPNTIFGLTDQNLFYYIKGGLSEINRVPPTTSFTFTSYPYSQYSQMLIDISTIYYLISQGFLSADTDSNYSLQGNSLTIDHLSKLNSIMSAMFANINAALRLFKMNYVPLGTVKVERGAGFRQQQLFQAAPNGISFGNFLGVR